MAVAVAVKSPKRSCQETSSYDIVNSQSGSVQLAANAAPTCLPWVAQFPFSLGRTEQFNVQHQSKRTAINKFAESQKLQKNKICHENESFLDRRVVPSSNKERAKVPLLSHNCASLLSLIKRLRENTQIVTLDGDEELLLAWLALDWYEGRQVTVGQVMDHDEFRTRTYAYRRLSTLRKNDWVNLVTAPHDQRVKFVVPTDKTRRYLRSFSRSIDEYVTVKPLP